MKSFIGITASALLLGFSFQASAQNEKLSKVAYAYWSTPSAADTYLVVGTNWGEFQAHAESNNSAHIRILEGCYKVATYALINKTPVLFEASQSVSSSMSQAQIDAMGPFPRETVQAYSARCSIVDRTVNVPMEHGTPE